MPRDIEVKLSATTMTFSGKGRLHPRPEVDCQEAAPFLGYISQMADQG